MEASPTQLSDVEKLAKVDASVNKAKECARTEYNNFKKASVVYYQETEEGFKFLLCSDETDPTTFKVIKSEWSVSDAVITFTAARAIIEQTYGCLSPYTLGLLGEKKTLTNEDLIFSKLLHLPSVWQSKQYLETLKMITENTCQYDDVEEEIVYFNTVSSFDIELLNSSLANLGLKLCFQWFTEKEIVENNKSLVERSTQQLAERIGFKKHIDEMREYYRQPLSKQTIYILLLCKPPMNHYTYDVFYDHPSALYYGIFKRSRETWYTLNTATQDFPSEELLKQTKAIIVPGSPVSVYAPDDWGVKTRKWVVEFHEKYTKTKLLGICFGEQLICESLGGKTEPMPKRREEPNFYLSIVETVEMSPEILKLDFIQKKGGSIPLKAKIIESHGDEVTALPEGFDWMGGSETCKMEVIASKDGRYFGVQGHPEYTSSYFAARVSMYIMAMQKLDPTPENFLKTNQYLLENAYKGEPDFDYFRKLCYDFLKFEN